MPSRLSAANGTREKNVWKNMKNKSFSTPVIEFVKPAGKYMSVCI